MGSEIKSSKMTPKTPRCNQQTKLSSKLECAQLVAWLAVVCLIVSANLFIVCNSIAGISPAEARYLPTRADDTEITILKEIIRNLLAESRGDNGVWPQAAHPLHRIQLSGQHVFSQPPRAELNGGGGGHEISRRSGSGAELAQSISNGDESSLKPMLLTTGQGGDDQRQFYTDKLDG